ncbi:MAG: RNA-binding protein [Deltaproteobacteria bacterium]|nr:RNA-binding protein [Deltaproteobacteria bacterium]
MAKKIFIGELSGITTVASLKQAFAVFGEIVDIGIDADGGRIEYATEAAGDLAVHEMNGATLDRAVIRVFADQAEAPEGPLGSKPDDERDDDDEG